MASVGVHLLYGVARECAYRVLYPVQSAIPSTECYTQYGYKYQEHRSSTTRVFL